MLEAGGNHVLGYQQSFDLEGEHSGVIVARGLGTSVKLRPEAEPRSLTLTLALTLTLTLTLT